MTTNRAPFRSKTSKDSFANLIRERLPSPDVAKLRLDEFDFGFDKENAGTNGGNETAGKLVGGLSVDTLRKVFEKGSSVGKRKDDR